MSPDKPDPPANSLGQFSWMLLAVSGLLVGGSYLWRDIDFSKAVLLGSGIVALNLWWTRRVVSKAMRDVNSKPLLWISFLSKFGFTGLILFVAILRLDFDPLGILVGVSALVVTGFAFAFVRLGH